MSLLDHKTSHRNPAETPKLLEEKQQIVPEEMFEDRLRESSFILY